MGVSYSLVECRAMCGVVCIIISCVIGCTRIVHTHAHMHAHTYKHNIQGINENHEGLRVRVLYHAVYYSVAMTT